MKKSIKIALVLVSLCAAPAAFGWGYYSNGWGYGSSYGSCCNTCDTCNVCNTCGYGSYWY